MKASEFKQLIKEAVREAIREELAQPQQPLQEQIAATTYRRTGNSIEDMLAETRASMSPADFRNIANADSSMAQSFNRNMFMPTQNLKPTSDDPRAVQAAVASAPKVGLDLSQLPFINKAAAIVNTAAKKDKERFGG